MSLSSRESHADDIALARYSVISPLVCRKLSKAERLQVKADIQTATHIFPDNKVKVISRRCLERWCRWYLQGHPGKDGEVLIAAGIEALRPVLREDKGSPRVLDAAIVERAIALRREEPSRNTSALIGLLKAEANNDQRPLPEINEATLAYHLRLHRATKIDLKKEGRAFPRYEQPRRNATWQGDWTQGFLITDPSSPHKPRMCHLHAFLDDYSRYIVYAEFYFRQNLPCLEDCFRKGIVSGGVPERVYWDNGAVYHSRQIKMIAARLRTEVIFSTPYCPEGKGKIERFFRTVKDAFYPEAKRSGLQSLPELNEFFWGWLESAYQTKVHSETKTTPKIRWEEGAGAVHYPDPAGLVDLFLWEQERQVDKSGCIQISGNLYPVAEHLVGHRVTVRFDPFDISRVRLYEGYQCTQILEPQTLVNRTFRKAIRKKGQADSQLSSSSLLREQITKDFQRRARQTLSQARGNKPTDLLSEIEFRGLVQDALAARNLSAAEGNLIRDFYARNAPLLQSLVCLAMQRAVEMKGATRHIRYYLDCIQATRLNEGRNS